ncbi:MAG: type IX secretion system protein PorQ [Bacteroidales bacterium]
MVDRLKILIILQLIILASAGSLFAQDGSNAYNFLNVTSSSHVYGLGGNNISIIETDVNMIDQNPALLGVEFDKQLGINYMRYLGSSNFMSAAYANSAGEHGAWSIGIKYYGYGSIPSADADGTITGEFSPQDIAFTGTYSHDFTDRLRGGLTLKFVNSTYADYSAFAVCVDLGLNYYNPDRGSSLSLVVKNLGGQIKQFDSESDTMPWDVQLGWTQELTELPLRFSVTANNLSSWSLPYYTLEDDSSSTSELVLKDDFINNLFRHLIFAIECVPSDKFYIGLGYSYKTRTDMSTYSRNFVSGFSVSTGFNVGAVGFGVAVSQPHIGGTSLMFNLTTNINELLR